jgi:hypothetical protein
MFGLPASLRYARVQELNAPRSSIAIGRNAYLSRRSVRTRISERVVAFTTLTAMEGVITVVCRFVDILPI